MTQPTLVILAAGMGSRYGGLKQIDPVGPGGEIILDYSVHDAIKAGFGDVVIVIKSQMKADFIEVAGRRLAEHTTVHYACQDLSQLPEGYAIPEGREKPWGTAQAVLAAKDLINGPFSVINADDFYGAESFEAIARFLADEPQDDRLAHLAMVGYRIENTLTDHGSVARGVCAVDAHNRLVQINERTQIERGPAGARYTLDSGQTWTDIPAGTFVSMNLWGFTPAYLAATEAGFPAFLDRGLAENPLKCEYQLPSVVQAMMESGAADVTVLPSEERWYGVTYHEDKPTVVQALAAKHQAGTYPIPLWEN